MEPPIQQWLEQDHSLDEAELRKRLLNTLEQDYQDKKIKVGSELMAQVEKSIMLQVLDGLWREHLAAMDNLRQGIHLRG